MNPYAIADLASSTADSASLRARLLAWHDAMVTHERQLRSDPAAALCDDECPHVEATALWREARVSCERIDIPAITCAWRREAPNRER
jgi:hypothetical protein